MTASDWFEEAFAGAPLMAILRGMGVERSARLATTAWDLGLDSVEVPLQTEEDERALREVVRLAAERGKVVGAGTIITPDQVERAAAAGAAYLVSPGIDPVVVRAAQERGIPILPGVATPSEVQLGVSLGLTWLKAFPAEWLGVDWFRHIRGPFPQVRFVATGRPGCGQRRVVPGCRGACRGRRLGARRPEAARRARGRRAWRALTVGSFAVGETDFLLDGRPHRILSGAIHYFRVHPDLWADRIRKARLMGLNTIETYVAWNAHEPRRGEWDATGWNDLGRFLDLIAEEGMHAIVRPGPYICAEWHNGGLPVWLTGIPGIGLRRSEPQYLAEVQTYLERVYEIVAPRQIDRGGPVTLVQIENEYGAYGDDKDYLRELVRVTRDAGITVPLTTIDQPTPQMLGDGSLEGLHATGSFGSRATERLAALRAHQHTGPLMCAEFWDGWFDWWGGHHHTTSVADAAGELESLLAAGASVNFYMFHGGTNFGLTERRQRQGPLPSPRHVVRLRRSAGRSGQPDREVLRVPGCDRPLCRRARRAAARGSARAGVRRRAQRGRAVAGVQHPVRRCTRPRRPSRSSTT